MADLPILGYKRHPRPMLRKPNIRYHKSQELTKENHTTAVEKVTGTKNDNYDLGVYLDNELQRLENSFDTNTQQTNVLDVGVKEIKQNIISINNATGANTAAISQEANTRTTADSALATLVSNLSSTVGSGDSANAALVSNEALARANADSALASTTSDLAVTVGDVSGSVSVEAEARIAADNNLLSKYGVTLNSNGYVTGFSQNNNGTTGTFKILADKFTIIDPSDSAGEAGTQVFSIVGGIVTMGTAHIGNLSIGTGKISDNAVSVSSFAQHALQTGLSNKTFSTTVSMASAGTVTVICKAGVFGSGSSPTVSLSLTIDGTLQDSLNATGTPALGTHLLLGSKEVSSGNKVITVGYTNLANTTNPSQRAQFVVLRRFK